MLRAMMTPEQGELFIGGLLAVARADGMVLPEEIRELRVLAAEHEVSMPVEEDLLFMPEIGPTQLARAGVPGPAFLAAALRIAMADRELVAEEVRHLRELAKSFGCPTDDVPGWKVVASYQLDS
jgi:hypothetical protein